MPVLGRRIGQCVADGEITVDRTGDEPVVRYFDKVFPVRAGTLDLPLVDLLDRQFYRLAHWRVGDEELNYRRFFDIDTLVAIRVEDARVFAETHAVLLALVRRGTRRRAAHRPSRRAGGAARLRPSACTGRPMVPGWSSRRSSRATRCCRTTGRVRARQGTTRCCGRAACSSTRPVPNRWPPSTPPSPVNRTDFAPVVEEAKRWVVEHGLAAEVHRLVDLAADDLPQPPRAARPHPARVARVAGRAARRVPGLPRLRRARRARARGGAATSSTHAVERGPPAAARGAARHPRPRRRARARRRWPGSAPRRVRRALPADLRPGDGQGRRGHRLLPMAAAHRAQRGRRRPRRTSACARTSCTRGASAPSATGRTR